MKKLTNQWMWLLLGFILLWAACQSGPEEDPAPKDNNNEDTTEVVDDQPPAGNDDMDANELTDNIIIENATKIPGTIPTGTALADLKMDKDTLFFIEGYKNRIRILYPKGAYMGTSSFYVQIEGADNYLDVKPEEEESSDTVGVLYIEFDPGDYELPVTFPIEISPHDDNGNLIDTFKKDVIIEKKQDNTCSPGGPEGDSNWLWLWTTIDGNFYSAPGKPVGTEATTNGCCLEGVSVDCISNAIPEEDWRSINYAAYLMTNMEYISFKNDGTMLGELKEQTQNLDYSESDFCSGVPEYVRSTNNYNFWGEYTYEPSGSRVFFTKIESTEHEICYDALGFCDYYYDKHYISTEFHYEILSCHFLIETSALEGQLVHRLFERRQEIINGEEWAYWYD